MDSAFSPEEGLAALPQPFDDMAIENLPKPRPLRPTIFPLHPILSKSGSPIHSPTREMSRRSSSAGSCGSNKSVHFPYHDHQLTSFQFTHSRDQYDRSPIIPSCEDLEIPSCKKAGSGAWMRCLQRKAKEASEAGQAPPFISSVFSGDLSHPAPSPADVPGLLHEDWSSSSESDEHLSPTSYTPPHDNLCAISSSQLSTALLSHSMLDTPRSFCWDTVRPESDVYEDDADDSEVQTIRSKHGSQEGSEASGDESEHDLVSQDGECEDDDEFVDSDEEAEGRMGIVGLGKFSRSSLYADDDLLGGCACFPALLLYLC